MEAIHTFWNSREYVPVKELRRDAANLDIYAVPGCDSGGRPGLSRLFNSRGTDFAAVNRN